MFVLRPGQSWAGSQVTVIVRAATANRAASVSPKPAIGDDTHGHRLRRLAGWRNRRHGGTLRLSLTKAAWGLPDWSGRTGSSPHPRRVPSSFRMRSLNRCRPALGMSTRAVLRIHTATNEGKERTSRIIHTSGDLEHLEQFSGENCSAPV